MNQILSGKIIEIAHVRRSFGYRRIHDLLRPEHPGINHKRVYRLYKAAELAVRKRRKAKRPMSERVPLQAASMVDEAWSMDFVSDSLVNGRRLKCLTVADDCSQECIDIAVDLGIGGEWVTQSITAVHYSSRKLEKLSPCPWNRQQPDAWVGVTGSSGRRARYDAMYRLERATCNRM